MKIHQNQSKALKSFQKAQDFLRLGSLYKAYRGFEMAYLKGYSQAETFLGMGIVNLHQLNLYAALEQFNRVLIHADSSTGVNYYIGQCYYHLGNDNEAFSHYYRAFKSSRNFWIRIQAFMVLHRYKQITLQDQESFMKNDWKHHLSSIHDDYLSQYCEALLERIHENYDASTSLFKQLLERYPKYYQTYIELGKNAFNTQRYRKAVEYYEKSLHLSVENRLIDFDRAKAYYELHDFHSSRKILKRLTQTILTNYKIYYNLATSCYRLERYAEAIKFYHASIENNPNRFQSYFNLGNSCYKIGLLDESEKHYKRAKTLHQKNTGIFYNLGILYFLQKRYTESVKSFDMAYELDKSDNRIFHNFNIAKNLKLIDPNEEIKHRIPFLINVLLFFITLILVVVILYFLQG